MPLRVSIRALMAFVVCFAVVFASLQQPTDLWANAMFTIAVAVVGLSAVGYLFGPRGQRATWGGVLLFGGGYLVLGFGPWFEDRVMPRLVSTALADAAYAGMSYTPTRVGQPVWYESYSRPSQHFVLAITQEVKPGSTTFKVMMGNALMNCSATQLRPLSRDAYRQLCHSDASLFFALIGALVGRFFAAGWE
jgi:hypothetical protein